ncbi:MAG: SpoIIE family protein phosphatase [Clostridiales bacterium]|nr:SpoIIE family protein phosphatase [Clostridiales bacterium]
MKEKTYKKKLAVRQLIHIILIIVVFSAIVSFVGFMGFTEVMMNQYVTGGYRIANTAKDYIDPDRLEEWLAGDGTSADYLIVWNRLDKLCNSSQSTFIYVIKPSDEYWNVNYIFSTVNHETTYSPYEVGFVRATTNQEAHDKYKAVWEGTSEGESMHLWSLRYSSSTYHITIMVPLKGNDGTTKGILCVQRQMTEMVRARAIYLGIVLAITVIITVAVIILEVNYQRKTLIKPLETITGEASRFADENVPPEQKLESKISNKDEIGILAGSIDQMEERITNYIKDITEITARNEKAKTELSLATRIQESMLPSIFPAFPDRTDFDIYASMNAAKEVGGDFYDFFLIDDTHLCMVMADVSGKGVPAALFMMASKIILANKAMTGISPAQILKDTNNTICSNNTEKMFVTVWLGILDLTTGKLTAANAGHEYPAIKHGDGKFELLRDKHGFVIGGMSNMKYTDYEVELEPGSKIFVYTDGVPEATDANEAMFGTDRMIDALNKDVDATPEQILKNVRSSVDEFVKDAEQFDDLTMLCLEYRGNKVETGEHVFDAAVEELPNVLAFVDDYLDKIQCDPKSRSQIHIAAEEIFVNIAHYAYNPDKGTASVSVETHENPGSITITFSDNGTPYNPLAKEDPDTTLAVGERPIGGLGIFMTKNIMDDVTYEYKDGKNVLTMTKKV